MVGNGEEAPAPKDLSTHDRVSSAESEGLWEFVVA
jgi:hypothetical protein